MKKTIKVEVKRRQLVCDADVPFCSVDERFGHFSHALSMDIIYPETPYLSKEVIHYPCILWICGGGWLSMDRSMHIAYLSRLAREGFVVASAEYRTSNIAPYPACLKDIKTAIRFLRARADRYNIDGKRIGVMGESAGGHLAAMAALNSSPDLDEGMYLEYPSNVQAVCAWFTPANFSIMPLKPGEEAASSMSLLLGKNIAVHTEDATQASPVSLVAPGEPPFLLLHGSTDTIVPPACSEELHDKLVAAGCDAELVMVEDAWHADIRFFQDEVQDMIAEFFSKKLKGAEA